MLKDVKASILDISSVGLATNSFGSVVMSSRSGNPTMPYNKTATPKARETHFRLGNRGLSVISFPSLCRSAVRTVVEFVLVVMMLHPLLSKT